MVLGRCPPQDLARPAGGGQRPCGGPGPPHYCCDPGSLGSLPKNCSWSRGGVLKTTQGFPPDLGTSLVQSARSTPSSSTPSSRPASLGYSGAAGPRPITQSELATALALASTPESSSHTPTPGTQVWREGGKVQAKPPGMERGVGSPGRAPRYGERGWEGPGQAPRYGERGGKSRPGPQGEGPSGRVGLPLLILVLHLL